MSSIIQQCLTVKAVAQAVNCSPDTVYSALLSGELRGYQRTAPKGRWSIFPADVNAWIRGGVTA